MIIILKGGSSAEREVSLNTAASIATALTQLGHTFTEVDAADMDWLDQITSHTPKLVFIALHGPYGEDGTVQSLLEERGIAYVGSTAQVSALCMDKEATKKQVAAKGIAVPKGMVFQPGLEWKNGYPAVVKPNANGSSFGVTIVHSPEELTRAITNAQEYSDQVLIEEWVSGLELSCGVVEIHNKKKVLPIVEIRPNGEFFDYEAKYSENECLEICPAQIDPKITQKIQEQTLQAYLELECRHYARVDWILHNNVPYFLEINTLPGMTSTSLLPKALAAAAISYQTFIDNFLNC